MDQVSYNLGVHFVYGYGVVYEPMMGSKIVDEVLDHALETQGRIILRILTMLKHLTHH